MSAELGGQYADVLSASDVALYGGLTALASLERSELKASVMDSIGFRELLELNPEARNPPPFCNSQKAFLAIVYSRVHGGAGL